VTGRYKYGKDAYDNKYSPYSNKDKTMDFTRRAFDTKIKQDLIKFNGKSEKLYEDVKESIQVLYNYYHDFGTQINSIIHNNQIINILETTQSFSSTIAMLDKYRILHDDISKNLETWDKDQHGKIWDEAKTYENNIRNFFEIDLKQHIEKLYSRGIQKYHDNINASLTNFQHSDIGIMQKVQHLNEEVAYIYKTVSENQYLLANLQHDSIRKEAFSTLYNLKRVIDASSILKTEGNLVETNIIDEEKFSVISETQNCSTYQVPKLVSSKELSQGNSLRETTEISRTTSDVKSQRRDISSSTVKRIRKETIQKLMDTIREWEPGKRTIQALLQDDKFKSTYQNDVAYKIFEDLQEKLPYDDENVSENNKSILEAAWELIREKALKIENKGIRFGLRYLAGVHDNKTDDEDLEIVELNSDKYKSEEKANNTLLFQRFKCYNKLIGDVSFSSKIDTLKLKLRQLKSMYKTAGNLDGAKKIYKIQESLFIIYPTQGANRLTNEKGEQVELDPKIRRRDALQYICDSTFDSYYAAEVDAGEIVSELKQKIDELMRKEANIS
jgi:hypothetical protein